MRTIRPFRLRRQNAHTPLERARIIGAVTNGGRFITPRQDAVPTACRGIEPQAVGVLDSSFRLAEIARVRPGAVGVPAATRQAILTIVDAEQPPLRIFFGRNMIETARAEYEQRLQTWEAWRAVTEAAHGNPSA